MSDAVTLRAAASALNVDVTTMRRWVATGCPVARRGRRGPGGEALVHVDDVRAWRGLPGANGAASQAFARNWLEKLGEGLRAFHSTGEAGKVGLSVEAAALLFVELFKFIAWRHGGGSRELPFEVQRLEAVAMNSRTAREMVECDMDSNKESS